MRSPVLIMALAPIPISFLVLSFFLMCAPLAFGGFELCPAQVPEIVKIDNQIFYRYRNCGMQKRTALFSHIQDEPVMYSPERYTIFSTDDSDFRVYDPQSYMSTLISGTLGVIIFFSVLGFGMRILCP